MMSNPHTKEDWFLHYLEEKEYVNDVWFDTGMWAEVGGLGLIICTISIQTGWSCNAGFRIVDENDLPLQPYRTKGNRHPVHFTSEPNPYSTEDLTPLTFHMIANCQYAKLQIRPSDFSGTYGDQPGFIRINYIIGSSIRDAAWSHKPISTMSVLPLVPSYQGGANTIFKYPQSRIRKSESSDPKDRKPFISEITSSP